MPTKDSEYLAQMARSLKGIETQQHRQTRILETLNHNLVELFKSPSDIVEPAQTKSSAPSRTVYGWTQAAELQSLGQLKIGDMKTEADESLWIWIGETWERVDFSSGRIE